MNKYGWLFMIISWTVILSLLVFCIYQVLFKKKEPGNNE